MEPFGSSVNPSGLNNADYEPCLVDTQMLLAQNHIEKGDLAQAECIYDSILLNSPKNLQVLKARAVLLTLAARYESALLDAKLIVELNPNDGETYWMLAGLLRRIYGEQGEDVLQAYNTAYQLDPLNPYLRLERADILRSHNRYTEAVTEYAEVAECAEHEEILLEARYKEGCVAMVLGLNEQAKLALLTVLEISPGYEEAEIMYQLIN